MAVDTGSQSNIDVSANISVVYMVNAANLVPEHYQNILMGWRDAFRAGYFEIGDIANELVEEAAERGYLGGEVTQQSVFDAVGRFCGKSGRTVRYYAETAAFYDADTREQYDVLPFSHFVFARSMGESWRDVLEFAKERPHLSVDALRVPFLVAQPGGPQEIRAGAGDPGHAPGVAAGVIQTDSHSVYRHFSQLVHSLEYLLSVAEHLGLEEQTRVDLESSLYLLREEILPKIAFAINNKHKSQ